MKTYGNVVNVDLRGEERVAVVTLTNGAENRFSPELVAGMMAALDDLERDDAVGALVVTGGDPKFFSNGLDLDWILMHIAEPEAIAGYLRTVNAMFKRVTLYPKPIVAALNGHTFAAGVFLSAHMDFRFMRADRGWICLPEVDINIPLMPAMIAICQAVMNPTGFRRLYYTGARLTAPQAIETGFLDGIHPAADLVPKSVEFAAGLAKKKTATYAEMKRRMRGDIARMLDEVDPPMFLKTLAFSMPG
jgi:enoyl-CoA hydratase/carnithine racemase